MHRLPPHVRQRLRMALLQEGHHGFADEAAQVEEGGAVRGAHQDPHPDVAVGGIRDLQDAHAAVPQVRSVQHRSELGTHVLDGSPPVEVELHGAHHLGLAAGPVLERRGGEVRGRQDQPAVIPDVDYHVGQGDLLDPAPLLLDHHHVVHPDRVGEGQLHAGEHVHQRRLGGEACHDGDHAGGGKQPGAEGLNGGEGQHHAACRQHHDEGHADPACQDHLGPQAPGPAVVRHVHAVAAEHQCLHDQQHRDGEPGQGAYEGDQQEMVDGGPPPAVVGGQHQRDADADQAECQPQRKPRHSGGGVELGAAAVEPEDCLTDQPGEDQACRYCERRGQEGHCRGEEFLHWLSSIKLPGTTEIQPAAGVPITFGHRLDLLLGRSRAAVHN
ncbi:hypothetical protein D9M72_410780 [compost metagenome]